MKQTKLNGNEKFKWIRNLSENECCAIGITHIARGH